MDEYKLSAIFIDTCSDLFDTNSKICQKKLDIDDFEKLENNLQIYLKHILGPKLEIDYTLYFREIRKCFENILLNAKHKDFENINQFILDYKEEFFTKIYNRPTASTFIFTLKKLYTSDFAGTVIGNVGNSYTVERLARKEEDDMPAAFIENIDSFELVLNNFVEKVRNSNSFFNSFFEGMGEEESIAYLFEWVIKNATYKDMANVEQYFKKYTDFITDTTFDNFRKPLNMGDLLGNELYIMRKRANVNYETPYYLSFMMKKDNGCVELPTIRLGIEDNDGTKIAHILATQTSQGNINFEKYDELNDYFKKMLSKSKYFREFNPSHVISLILAFGVLKGMNIDKVIVEDYLPLRLQRLINENQKDEDELDNLQYRLTTKNMYNYLRLCEFFKGIVIAEYPEMGDGLVLLLTDNIHSDNEFLQKLYNMGYKTGLDNNISNLEKSKKET